MEIVFLANNVHVCPTYLTVDGGTLECSVVVSLVSNYQVDIYCGIFNFWPIYFNTAFFVHIQLP